MKKSIKPLIVFSVSIFVLIALLTLVYVGTKLECERLTREKVLAQDKLQDIRNWRINLTAQNEALSSRERIVSIAQAELGMVERAEPAVIMNVSKEKIDRITKVIEKKYEQ